MSRQYSQRVIALTINTLAPFELLILTRQVSKIRL